MARPLHPGSGRPPARRRCFVCGIGPDNTAGIFVGACVLSRGAYVTPRRGAKARYMRAAALSIGVCELCLADAMKDGRIYRSANLRATMRTESASSADGSHSASEEATRSPFCSP